MVRLLKDILYTVRIRVYYTTFEYELTEYELTEYVLSEYVLTEYDSIHFVLLGRIIYYALTDCTS